jgi:DnaJ-class molecular chaperone
MSTRGKLTIEIEDPETGDNVEIELPAAWEICHRCDGDGKHDHPAFSNGITSDEWNGPDWDDESRESYLRGAYDVQCSVCNGSGKILVVDEDKLTPAQRDTWEKHLRSEAASRAEQRSNERFGY